MAGVRVNPGAPGSTKPTPATRDTPNGYGRPNPKAAPPKKAKPKRAGATVAVPGAYEGPQYPDLDVGMRPAPPGSFGRQSKMILSLLGRTPKGLRPMGEPAMQKQSRSYVEAQTEPLLDDLGARMGRQREAGMGAIEGFTNRQATMLGEQAPKIGHAFDQLQANDQAAAAALTGGQRAAGAGVTSELEAKMQQAGIPAAALGDVGAVGAGAAGALGAEGYAGLSRLIAEGGNQRAFAETLPGIARLGGLQDAHELGLAGQRQYADEAGRINARVPGLIADMNEAQRGRELQKADMTLGHRARRAGSIADLSNRFQDRELERSVGRMGFGTDIATLGQQAALSNREIDASTADMLNDFRTDRVAEMGRNQRAAAKRRGSSAEKRKDRAAAEKRAKITAGGKQTGGLTPPKPK